MADAVAYILIGSIAIVWCLLLCMVYRNRPGSTREDQDCRGAASAGAKRGSRG